MDHTANLKVEQLEHDWQASDGTSRLRKWKKRRRPPRRKRKPARPPSYIGQRSNNRMRRI